MNSKAKERQVKYSSKGLTTPVFTFLRQAVSRLPRGADVYNQQTLPRASLYIVERIREPGVK